MQNVKKSFLMIISLALSISLGLPSLGFAKPEDSISTNMAKPVLSNTRTSSSIVSSTGYKIPNVDTDAINDYSIEETQKNRDLSLQDTLPTGYDLSGVIGNGIVSSPPSNSSGLQTVNPANPPSSLLLPMRDQGAYGCCWAFAATASASASASVLTGAAANNNNTNASVRLSPNHTTFGAYNPYTYEPQQGYISYALDAFEDGGNSYYATAAWSKWFGPALETKFPYPTTPTGANYPKAISSLTQLQTTDYHLKNTYIFPSPRNSNGNVSIANINAIKQGLMTYGPLATAFYTDEDDGNHNYNANNYSYYSPSVKDPNHAVTIVGWDDNWSAANFSTGSQPKNPAGNGAFIIQNSWGPEVGYTASSQPVWGDEGYFFLSYYDYTMQESTFFELSSKTDEAEIYYTDELGFMGETLGYGLSTEYMANVLTVPSGVGLQNIDAVSVFATDPGLTFEVQIYDNPKNGSPVSGQFIDTGSTSATFAQAGYHTIRLNKPALMYSGDTFSVVITVKKPRASSSVLSLESGNTSAGDHLTISANQSYVSSNNKTWTDLVEYKSDGCGNLNIKAFSNPATNITKISLANATMSPFSIPWTNGQIKATPIISLESKKLVAGRDFSVIYGANNTVGLNKLTITGINKYNGSASYTFTIVPKGMSIKKLTTGKKRLTMTWAKLPSANKISNYQIQYRKKGTKSYKSLKASKNKSKLIIKGLSSKKKYQVRICAISKTGGKTYTGAWSNLKTSKTIK